MPILTFTIGQQQYGFRVEEVREIAPVAALVGLVGAPPFLKGLLSLRGRYVPVLDGRVLVNATPHFSLENQIIIVGRQEAELGLLVDQVHGVQADHDTAATLLGEESAAPFLQAIVSIGETPVLLLDRAALLALIPSFAQAGAAEAMVS